MPARNEAILLQHTMETDLKYKPTSEDKRIIRDCAQRDAGFKRVEICASTRHNIEQDLGVGEHMNVAFVSARDDFSDTDLSDNSYKWSDFTKGVELTEDGRGVFDFWVYSLGYHGQLETNVTAYYENGKLVRVDGTGKKGLWTE